MGGVLALNTLGTTVSTVSTSWYVGGGGVPISTLGGGVPTVSRESKNILYPKYLL